MKVRLGVVTVLLGGSLATGCGPDQDYVPSAVPRGDPDYAFAALRHAYTGDEGLQPENLADALPNHVVRLKGTDFTATFSDGLVVGKVSRVSKGNGTIWGGVGPTSVSYDDPRADTHWVIVEVTPGEKVGLSTNRDPVLFRVLVPQEADPERFAEGLAGLDRVVVLLDYDPTRTQNTPLRPILNDRLIGVVAGDGTMTFPGLARGRATFAGDFRDADQLVAAARALQTTTRIDLPQLKRSQ